MSVTTSSARSTPRSGVERLYIHIGTHKTGSSALQSALVQLTDLPDVLYPLTGRVSVGGHLNIAWQAVNDRRFRPERGTSAELIQEIWAAAPRTVILSAETFSAWPGTPMIPDWALSLAQSVNAKQTYIVGYVRPQWEYLESHYTQMVKIGATTKTFADFVSTERTRPLFNYPLVFSEWNKRFIPTVIVRPYTPKVVQDFFNFVGLAPPPQERRVNMRPGHRQLELLRRLGREVSMPKEHRQAIFRRAEAYLRRHIRDDLPARYLTIDLALDLYNAFCDSNKDLADEYWEGHLPSSFGRPTRIPTPQPQNAEPDTSDDFIYRRLLDYVAQWLDELGSE